VIISDSTIVNLLQSGDLLILPDPSDRQIQPVSVDLRLGNSWCHLPRDPEDRTGHHRIISEEMNVRPGAFVLGCTLERIKLPSYLAGVVKGKSSWARRGIMVEAAGLVDPGFDGQITLEIKNLSHLPRLLRAGDMIAQIMFLPVDKSVTRPYGSAGLGSHYQGQRGAEPAHG
jgi:dCTP deaminase